MGKLDSLGWDYELAFRSFGLNIGIRATDPKIAGWLTDCLPPHWEQSNEVEVDRLYSFVAGGQEGRVKRFNIVYANTGALVRTLDTELAKDSLRTDLQLYIAEKSPSFVFVHAGVVGWNEAGILIPGRSFSGKSTLVAELARAGALYYSDEFAVLDEQGRALPYARPLQLRDAKGNSAWHSVESLGGRQGTEPLPIKLVLSTKFEATAAEWRPVSMTAGEAVLEMFENSVAARSRPEDVMPVLARAALRSTSLKGGRGEARNIVDSLFDIVESMSE